MTPARHITLTSGQGDVLIDVRPHKRPLQWQIARGAPRQLVGALDAINLPAV